MFSTWILFCSLGIDGKSKSPTKTPKKKKIERKSTENIAVDVFIEFLGHGLMTYTEQQRDNFVNF